MRLLWLCNMVPGAVREAMDGGNSSGLWVDHVLSDLRSRGDMEIEILCRDVKSAEGSVDAETHYTVFAEPLPQNYEKNLEDLFYNKLQSFAPDVIHIWGTEYGHTLAMLNASAAAGLLDKTVVSIQGLCSVYAGHFAEGVPYAVQRSSSFRDFVRRDNILQQRDKYTQRGELEVQALRKARHVIGRTDWDRACVYKVNPNARYHFCNETLRKPFYEGTWSYASCKPHQIFASSCSVPLKGFHYLLDAFLQVLKAYPDATLTVPGRSFLVTGGKEKLLQQTYHRYLAKIVRDNGLEDKITFLGSLSPEGMKQAYLSANVFALPSSIENSPNSLGEAMLLGVPCVAADVGGVSNMMTHNQEGYIYQPAAPYMLAHYIEKIFAMEDAAKSLGAAAAAHARSTHDPNKNREDLLAIYRSLADGKGEQETKL